MKQLIVAFIALAFAGFSFASNNVENPCGNSGNNCNNTVNSTQSQGQTQGQNTFNSNTNSVDSQNINANSNQNNAQGGSLTATFSGLGGQSSNSYSNSQGGKGGRGGNATGGAGGSANATGGSGGSVSDSGNSVVGVSNNGNSTGNSSNSIVVQGDAAQERNPVATAVAPIVYTGTDQCLVSVAGGAQAVGFGISIGSAVPDKICEALKLTRQLEAMGYKAQALKLLKAADPRVAEAFQ